MAVVEMNQPTLSIVTTAYRSQSTIDEFIKRAMAAAEQVSSQIELIVVDDGSPDQSADVVRRIIDRDNRVRLVRFSRNFGHHKALLAGLEHSRGELVFLIDSDLEEAPELLIDMFAAFKRNPVDCLYGVQKSRKGGYVERVSGRLFYWLYGALSEVEIPENVATVRLMTRRYINSFLLYQDKNPIFVPLSVLTGYPQAAFEFTKQNTSRTTYSLRRRIALMVFALTAFSGKPLQMMFTLSVLLSGIGFVYGLYVIGMALFRDVQDGWSSLMAVVVFFFSLNALFTGLIGLYVKQVLDEVKQRPRTVVQEVFGGIEFDDRSTDDLRPNFETDLPKEERSA